MQFSICQIGFTAIQKNILLIKKSIVILRYNLQAWEQRSRQNFQ